MVQYQIVWFTGFRCMHDLCGWGYYTLLKNSYKNAIFSIPSSCFKIVAAIGKVQFSYDVASESEITPCNKIDKPLVVYRFTGNVMTSITTLRT